MEVSHPKFETSFGVAPTGWKLIELRQIVCDKRLPSGLYKEKQCYGKGTKIIKLGDVFAYDFFVPDSAQRVELNDSEIKNFRVIIGDIIIALASVKLEGVGEVMLVQALDDHTVYDHNVALIRMIKGLSQRYIFYLFKSTFVRKLIANQATQVGTTFLKTSTILNFILPIPDSLTEQKAIAD